MRMSFRHARILSAFFTGLALLSTPGIAQQPPRPSALPYRNPALPVDGVASENGPDRTLELAQRSELALAESCGVPTIGSTR